MLIATPQPANNKRSISLISLATDAAGNSAGSFTLNQAGTAWTFTPTEHFNGTVNLSYNVTDGTASTAATNTFELASVNDAPDTGVKASLANGTEDLEYTINAADLLAGYTDADIDNDAGSTQSLAILGLSAEEGGVITDNQDGTYTFKPNPDINGTITLKYVISDGVGGNALATNTFSIDAVNDKPIRTAGNVSTLYLQEDQEIASMGLDGLTYSVGGGSDEADAQTLSYTITALPDAAIGSVFLADGTTTVTEQQTLTLEQLQGLKFLPALNAAGQVSFSFSVADSGSSDGDGNIINAAESITETVNINILGFNDAPILPVDAITLADGTEDTAYNFTAADLLAGVTDPDISPMASKMSTTFKSQASPPPTAPSPLTPIPTSPLPPMPTSTASPTSTTPSAMALPPSPTPLHSTSLPLTTPLTPPSRRCSNHHRRQQRN